MHTLYADKAEQNYVRYLNDVVYDTTKGVPLHLQMLYPKVPAELAESRAAERERRPARELSDAEKDVRGDVAAASGEGDFRTEALPDRGEKTRRIDAERTVDDIQRGQDLFRCREGGGCIVAVGKSGIAAAQDPDSVPVPDQGRALLDRGRGDTRTAGFTVCGAAGPFFFHGRNRPGRGRGRAGTVRA